MSVDASTESLLDAGSIPAASIFEKQMRRVNSFLILFIFLLSVILPLSINVRTFDHSDFTRIVFEGDSSFAYNIESGSAKSFVFSLNSSSKIENFKIQLTNSKLIEKVEYIGEKHKKEKNRFKVSMKDNFRIRKSFVLEDPFRVVFDLEKKEGESEKVPGEEFSSSEEQPEKTLVIDTICIDAGHGGSDLGAVGRSNIKEKDITLKVAKKLKSIIDRKLGLRVIMTRDSDVEVALDSRVARANNQKAQLFLSIHVNSSFKKAARGPETFFVSLKATDKVSYQLALKENSSFNGMEKLPEDDELKMILWNMAQTEYIKESSKLADYIQYELNILMSTKNRGVKQAPFRVLMRASMPAVLIEIAFVSNLNEERKLKSDSFLDDVAAALYRGVSKFIYYYNNRFK
ncbi:N-acetylmuramoyl-L-alanine amidase [Candidatus Methanophagaceae archaeon]|nr:N-acetylmuramoyl-L-alanine amidase [Methanophagales archaeon]